MNVRIFSIIVTVTLWATSEAVVAEGIYAGAGVGSIQIEDEGSGYSINDFPFGSRVFVGFEASQTLAFEGVFFKSDAATQSDGLRDTRVGFRGIAVYGAASAPSGDQGHFLARLGLFTGNREITSVTQAIDIRTSGIALGIGYIFDLTERFSIRGDFDTFLLSEFDTLSSGTIGVQFRFGD